MNHKHTSSLLDFPIFVSLNMEQNRPTALAIISIDSVINNIWSTREQTISKLLIDSALLEFMENHFDTLALSPIKIEFLKRDLKLLKEAPLDLVYYASLTKQLKESNSHHVDKDHSLIVQEIISVFKKYGH